MVLIKLPRDNTKSNLLNFFSKGVIHAMTHTKREKTHIPWALSVHTD